MWLGLGIRITNWWRSVLSGPFNGHATLTNGLVSVWPVSTDGFDAHDSNDLTNNNVVKFVPLGPSGVVADFVAANSEHLSGGSVTLAADFTWTGWVKVTSAGNDMPIFGVGDSWPNQMAINLRTLINNGGIYILTSDGIASVVAFMATGQLTNNWLFVVATYNSSTKIATLNINNGFDVVSTTPLVGTRYAGGTLEFGAAPFVNFADQHVGRSGLWSEVLDAPRIASLFNSGKGKSYSQLTTAEKVGLVSYWNLDEASGNRTDSHGSNTLTDNNTVGSATNPYPANMAGTVANFVAANSQSLTKTSADVSWLAGDFTISLWLKLLTPSIAPPSQNHLISVYPAFPDLRFFFKAQPLGGGNVNYIFTLGDGVGGQSAVNTTRVAEDSDWHNWVITRVLATDTLTIYRDTSTSWGTTTPIGVIDFDPPTTPAILSIGSGNNNTEFLNSAVVAAVDLWDRVLDASEISNLYNVGDGLFY